MTLLGMMDSKRTSKDIEDMRKRNNDSRRGDRKDLRSKDSNRQLYPEKD